MMVAVYKGGRNLGDQNQLGSCMLRFSSVKQHFYRYQPVSTSDPVQSQQPTITALSAVSTVRIDDQAVGVVADRRHYILKVGGRTLD